MRIGTGTLSSLKKDKRVQAVVSITAFFVRPVEPLTSNAEWIDELALDSKTGQLEIGYFELAIVRLMFQSTRSSSLRRCWLTDVILESLLTSSK